MTRFLLILALILALSGAAGAQIVIHPKGKGGGGGSKPLLGPGILNGGNFLLLGGNNLLTK